MYDQFWRERQHLSFRPQLRPNLVKITIIGPGVYLLSDIQTSNMYTQSRHRHNAERLRRLDQSAAEGGLRRRPPLLVRLTALARALPNCSRGLLQDRWIQPLLTHTKPFICGSYTCLPPAPPPLHVRPKPRRGGRGEEERV